MQGFFRPCLIVGMIGLLAGCGQGSGYADIDRFMAETRAKPRGHIEP